MGGHTEEGSDVMASQAGVRKPSKLVPFSVAVQTTVGVSSYTCTRVIIAIFSTVLLPGVIGTRQ